MAKLHINWKIEESFKYLSKSVLMVMNTVIRTMHIIDPIVSRVANCNLARHLWLKINGPSKISNIAPNLEARNYLAISTVHFKVCTNRCTK